MSIGRTLPPQEHPMTATQQAASGSSLITALEATWAAIRRRNPDLPEVVFITGTGLRSASAASVDARWGHFGAQRWVAGHPQPATPPTPEPGQDAKLQVPPDRKPELFVAGECFAEGAEHTFTTMLHVAGQGQPDPSAEGEDQGDGEAEGAGDKTFNRSKLVCDCYPERSIRVSPRQAERGPILCGICDGEFHPGDDGEG